MYQLWINIHAANIKTHTYTKKKWMDLEVEMVEEMRPWLSAVERCIGRKQTGTFKCTLDQVDKVKFRTWAVVTAQWVQGLPQAQGPEFESSVNPVLQQRAGGMRQNNLWWLLNWQSDKYSSKYDVKQGPTSTWASRREGWREGLSQHCPEFQWA